jgi:hypothetical protein
VREMNKAIFAFITLFILGTGCYTVIKHPAITDSSNPEFGHGVYYTDNCQDCHGNSEISLNVNDTPNLPRLNYIHRNERWSYYYDAAWWQRDMFTYNPLSPSQNSGNGPLPTTSARSRFPGANSGGSNAASPTSISGGSGGGSGSSTRIVGGSGQGSSTGSGSVRQSGSSNSNVRRATRGSGNSDSGSDSGSRNATRRKKK